MTTEAMEGTKAESSFLLSMTIQMLCLENNVSNKMV